MYLLEGVVPAAAEDCNSLFMQEGHDFEVTLIWLGLNTVFALLIALEPFVQAQVLAEFIEAFHFNLFLIRYVITAIHSGLEQPLKISQRQELPHTVASHLLGIAHHRRHVTTTLSTRYRFAFLMFKVAFIWIIRDMGKLAPREAGKPRAWFTQRLGTSGSNVFPSLLKMDLTTFILSFAGSLLILVSPPALTSSASSSGTYLPPQEWDVVIWKVLCQKHRAKAEPQPLRAVL